MQNQRKNGNRDIWSASVRLQCRMSKWSRCAGWISWLMLAYWHPIVGGEGAQPPCTLICHRILLSYHTPLYLGITSSCGYDTVMDLWLHIPVPTAPYCNTTHCRTSDGSQQCIETLFSQRVNQANTQAWDGIRQPSKVSTQRNNKEKKDICAWHSSVAGSYHNIPL